MSKRIFKYQLAPAELQYLDLPKGTRILSTHAQKNQLCVWAEVDTSIFEKERYYFKIYGTGHETDLDDSYKFLGTALMMGGDLVLHVFYKECDHASS